MKRFGTRRSPSPTAVDRDPRASGRQPLSWFKPSCPPGFICREQAKELSTQQKTAARRAFANLCVAFDVRPPASHQPLTSHVCPGVCMLIYPSANSVMSCRLRALQASFLARACIPRPTLSDIAPRLGAVPYASRLPRRSVLLPYLLTYCEPAYRGAASYRGARPP